MARLMANTSLDTRALDLNFYLANQTDTRFNNDIDLEILGQVYRDVFGYLADDGSGEQLLVALGPNLTVDGSGSLASGTVTALAFGAVDSDFGVILLDISLSAAALVAAIQTVGTEDDRALTVQVLAGHDSIRAGGSADFVEGFAGDDSIRGGGGNDTLDGGGDRDLIEAGGGADEVSGDTGRDWLQGDNGADTLDGGSGDDTLVGGSGRDRLVLGTGADAVRYGSAAAGGDTVVGFGDNDVFHFVQSNFGDLARGALAEARFQAREDNVAQDGGDRFVFRTTDSTLWFDADGNGATGPVLIATLAGGFALTAGDILIV